jgi:hypothetical protein
VRRSQQLREPSCNVEGLRIGCLGARMEEGNQREGGGRRWQLQQWEQKTETGGRYSQVAVGAARAKQSGGSDLLSLNFQGIEGVEAVVSPNFPHLGTGQGLGAADWARGSSWLIGPSGLVQPTGGTQRARAARSETGAKGGRSPFFCHLRGSEVSSSC